MPFDRFSNLREAVAFGIANGLPKMGVGLDELHELLHQRDVAISLICDVVLNAPKVQPVPNELTHNHDDTAADSAAQTEWFIAEKFRSLLIDIDVSDSANSGDSE